MKQIRGRTSGRLSFEQKKNIIHLSEKEEERRQMGWLVGLMASIWQEPHPLAALSSVKEREACLPGVRGERVQKQSEVGEQRFEPALWRYESSVVLVGSGLYINDSKPAVELISSKGVSCLDLGTGNVLVQMIQGCSFVGWVKHQRDKGFI